MQLKKLRDNAIMPEFKTAGAAAIDLHACIDNTELLTPEFPNVRPNRGKPSLVFLHKSAIYDIPEFLKFADLVHDDMSLRSLCPQTFAYQFYNVNR